MDNFYSITPKQIMQYSWKFNITVVDMLFDNQPNA